jgi:hypothetical protein
MAITTAGIKEDGAVPKSPGLALDSRERLAVIDDEVVPCVFAKRREYRVSGILQGEHDGERRTVSLVLGMFHEASLR